MRCLTNHDKVGVEAGADLVIGGPKQIPSMGPPHNNYVSFYAYPLFCSLALVYSLFIPSQPVISQPAAVLKPN